MAGQNVLFIMSDEHSRRVAGGFGNPLIRTPHIDQLAEQGTLFNDAYANCPICVPSR
jgi:choline-sulfatase